MANIDLLFLAIFIVVFNSQIYWLNAQHQCVHAQQSKLRKSNQSYSSRLRNLNQIPRDTSQVENIRITFGKWGISSLTVQQKEQIDSIMEASAKFYGSVIQVNPIKGLNQYNKDTTDCSSEDEWVVPLDDYKVGISDSDIHIYLTATNDTEDYLAWAFACNAGKNGPTFGRVHLNSRFVSTGSMNNDVYDDLLETVIHELMHVFGFDSENFQNWVDPVTNNIYGEQGLRNVIYNDSLKNATYLVTPNLVKYGQAYFNCSQLIGIPLEDEGDDGSAGSHFQRSAFGDECMTSDSNMNDCYFSMFSLLLLKDTNWYADIQFNLLDELNWGKGEGCDFINKGCKNSNKTEFCTQENEQRCVFGELGIGKCSLDDYFSNGCLKINYFTDAECQGPNGTDPNQNFGREIMGESTSRCFESSLFEIGKTTTQNHRCYNWACDSSGNTMTITVGDIPIICDQNDQIKTPIITGMAGTIKCPADIRRFCDFSNQCQNRCSQQGLCLQQVCYCNQGYSGIDCSIPCTTYTEQNQCVASCSNGRVTGPDHVCRNISLPAPKGYFFSTSSLQRCHYECQTCFGKESNQCSSCHSNAYLNQNRCYVYCFQDTVENKTKGLCNCPIGENSTCIEQCSDGFTPNTSGKYGTNSSSNSNITSNNTNTSLVSSSTKSNTILNAFTISTISLLSIICLI